MQNLDKVSLTVLIIDDNKMVLEMASEILQFLGHKALPANSGEEGIRIFREHNSQIDLVIVDLIMPGMSGKDCYEAIRATDKQIPIIISTGVSDAGEVENLKDLDVITFLEKPYTMPQLEEVLQKIKKKNRT